MTAHDSQTQIRVLMQTPSVGERLIDVHELLKMWNGWRDVVPWGNTLKREVEVLAKLDKDAVEEVLVSGRASF